MGIPLRGKKNEGVGAKAIEMGGGVRMVSLKVQKGGLRDEEELQECKDDRV